MSTQSYKRVDQAIKKVSGLKKPQPCKGIEGYEIGVALIKTMALSSWADVEGSAESFASIVHDNWGVGDKKCGNGILIFISVEDRVAHISTGKGADLRLSSSRCSKVVSKMGPLFGEERYGEALEIGLNEIEQYLKGEPAKGYSAIAVAIIIMVAAILVFMIYQAYKVEQERSKALRQVRQLENDRQKLMKNDYNITSCPICLEELEFPEDSQLTEDINADDEALEVSDREDLREESPTSPQESDVPPERRDSGYYRQKFLEKVGHGRRASRVDNAVNENNTNVGTNADLETGGDRSPFALKCGHIFCNSCIRSWLERHNTCPVCRESMGAQSRQASTPRPVRTRRDHLRIRRRMNNMLLWDEISYRAGRIHYYYPRYVTRGMVENFRREPQSTYLSRHKHFIKPKQKGGAQFRGTRKFGGGRSYGGGGGRW